LVQVWHDDLPLWEVRPKPKAIVSDKVNRRIMLPCASFALVLAIVRLCMLANVASSEPVSGGTGGGIYCQSRPCGMPTSQGNGPTSQPPARSSFPAPIFALGYALFSLIALLVGLGHAIAHSAWKWAGYGTPAGDLPGLAVLKHEYSAHGLMDV